MRIVYVSDEMKRVNEKEPEYEVTIMKYDNSTENIDDVLDVTFSENILSVATFNEIKYYRVKNLREWDVKKKEN